MDLKPSYDMVKGSGYKGDAYIPLFLHFFPKINYELRALGPFTSLKRPIQIGDSGFRS